MNNYINDSHNNEYDLIIQSLKTQLKNKETKINNLKLKLKNTISKEAEIIEKEEFTGEQFLYILKTLKRLYKTISSLEINKLPFKSYYVSNKNNIEINFSINILEDGIK